MKKSALFTIIFLFSISFIVPAFAQTKKDTVDVTVTVKQVGIDHVNIAGQVKPFGNAGMSYFELGDKQYETHSFNGLNSTEPSSVSISNLKCDSVYKVNFIATNEKGQILNSKQCKFKTKKCLSKAQKAQLKRKNKNWK